MNAYSKITACVVAALALTSCNTGSDKEQELSYTYQFELSSNDFSETGKWTYTDDTSVQNLSFPPFLRLSHRVIHDETLYWDGFVPVSGRETGDFAGDWDNHLWSSAAGGGALTSTNYLLAKWDPTESPVNVPELPVLAMGNAVMGATQSLYICNSNYVYHVMTSPEFNLQPTDYLNLIVKSVDENGNINAINTIELAKDGKVLKDWHMVTFEQVFGGGLYIQMEASREFGTGVGQIPPYFCLDNYSVFYKY